MVLHVLHFLRGPSVIHRPQRRWRRTVDSALLSVYVWYVRRRPRDVFLNAAERRNRGLHLTHVPRAALRVGRSLLLPFQIGGENSGRFRVGGIVLAQEAFEPKNPFGLGKALGRLVASCAG